MTEPIYRLRGLGMDYQGPAEAVRVLGSIDLEIMRGESLAILGASGSGKSTLLHLLGALDTPTRGSVEFDGQDITKLKPAAGHRLRVPVPPSAPRVHSAGERGHARAHLGGAQRAGFRYGLGRFGAFRA